MRTDLPSVTIEPAARERRILGRIRGDRPGPCLLIIGGIHGNEPSGVIAARRVLERFARTAPALAGDLVFLAGNLTALSSGSRFIDLDLNRQWMPDKVARLVEKPPGPEDPVEDREQHELIETIRSIVASARGPLCFLDLHTSSSDGPPFVTVGDTLRNRRFAQQFPLPLILGLEEQVDGALLELLNNHGFVTMGVEAGRHDAETSPGIHEAVIWLSLAAAGLMERDAIPELSRWQERLVASHGNHPRIVEVRHRHAITPEDGFRMEPGYCSFDPVTRGKIVAHDAAGPVEVPEDGMLLLPLYQGQGDDGFFVARPVRAIWLKLSALLRRLRLGGLLRFLPGVRAEGGTDGVFVIDTRIARLYPLEVFHLFGFRKLRRDGDRLVVSRRRYDLDPPQRITFH